MKLEGFRCATALVQCRDQLDMDPIVHRTFAAQGPEFRDQLEGTAKPEISIQSQVQGLHPQILQGCGLLGQARPRGRARHSWTAPEIERLRKQS